MYNRSKSIAEIRAIGVDGKHTDEGKSEGSGSSPDILDQKGHLLKVRSMKKQCKFMAPEEK